MTYVFRQGDLPKLDLQVDRGTDFAAWRSQWDAYFCLSGLDSQPAAKQIQALTLCLSRETVTIVDNLGLTVEQRGKVKDVITAIEQYVKGQTNETVERRNFRRRTQQQGESFDDYLVSLRELAKTCDFCSEACGQRNIRDQIIEGLLDGQLVEDLLKERDLTLADTVAKCRAHEAAKRQRAEMVGGLQEPGVQALHKPRPNIKEPTPKQTCPGCGSQFHPGGRRQCPAFRLVCHTCHKVGHLAKVCRSHELSQSTSGQDVSRPLAQTVTLSSPPYVNASSVPSQHIPPAPRISVYVSNQNGSTTIKALPDSRADISVAGTDIVDLIGDHTDNLLPSNVTPRTVSGQEMAPLGILPVTITLGNNAQEDVIYIDPNVKELLLSWKICKRLRILPDEYPSQPKPCVAAIPATQDTLPANPPEPLTLRPPPSRPFQEIAGDFCSFAGHQYLVLVDRHTDWPDIIPMGSNTTTTALTTALRSSFCRTGVPDIFWSDQGPQFTSKAFKEFAASWGFRHIMSSPEYPPRL